MNHMLNMATSSHYRLFTAKEKLRIIEDAENIGNRAAGRKYDVSKSCIRDWLKNKTRLQETNWSVTRIGEDYKGLAEMKTLVTSP